MNYYRWPKFYEIPFKFWPLRNWREKSLHSLLTEVKSLKKNPQSILEIGCGAGFLAGQLAQLFPQTIVRGVDISEEMVERARKSFSASNLSFENKNFWDLEGEKYELIISLNSWVFFPLRESIEKLESLLDEEGRIILVTSQKSPWSVLHRTFFSYIQGNLLYLHDPREVSSLLKERGFLSRWQMVNPFEGTYLFSASRKCCQK